MLIEASLKENPATLVLIGSSNKTDSQNPYNYELRKKILESEVSEKIMIWALPDFPSDIQWIEWILQYIPENVQVVNIYCGDKNNDSAIKSLSKYKNILSFTINIVEIPRSIIKISATQIRKWIKEENMVKLRKYLWENTLKTLKEEV